jgi:hypothetical protein
MEPRGALRDALRLPAAARRGAVGRGRKGTNLSGAVPILRRTGTFSACVNVAAGLFLVALGVLRLKGLL